MPCTWIHDAQSFIYNYYLRVGLFLSKIISIFYWTDDLRATHFPLEWLARIKADINYIIGEKRHMLKCMLQGLHDFNTNFRSYVRWDTNNNCLKSMNTLRHLLFVYHKFEAIESDEEHGQDELFLLKFFPL